MKRRRALKLVCAGTVSFAVLLKNNYSTVTGVKGLAFSQTKPSRLIKVKDIDIYRDAGYYCGPGPSPLALPGGKVLVAFRRSRSTGHFNPEVEMCLLSSDDGGKTWGTEPRVFDFGPITNPNLTLLKEGTVLYATHGFTLITKRTYERLKAEASGSHRLWSGDEWGIFALKSGTQVRSSRDAGKTWSQPYWVSPIKPIRDTLPGLPSPSAIRNPAYVLKDGSLVIPVYGVDLPETAYLMESFDGGISWNLRSTIAEPQGQIGFNETVLYECASGKLIAFMRSSGAEGYTFTTSSKDGGRNWSSPNRETLWGYPCSVLRMPSGRVLLTYGYRREPFGIRARLVDKDCAHIGEVDEVILRDDGGNRDLGYPSAALLPDGTALVAYYFNSKEDEGKQKYIAATIVQEV